MSDSFFAILPKPRNQGGSLIGRVMSYMSQIVMSSLCVLQISLVMPWKKARKLIRDDPRYKNFTESDHVRLQLAARKPTQYSRGT